MRLGVNLWLCVIIFLRARRLKLYSLHGDAFIRIAFSRSHSVIHSLQPLSLLVARRKRNTLPCGSRSASFLCRQISYYNRTDLLSTTAVTVISRSSDMTTEAATAYKVLEPGIEADRVELGIDSSGRHPSSMKTTIY